MTTSPVITCIFLEPAPRSSAEASRIGWPHSPDLVEASDEIIWSENNNELINLFSNTPSL